MATENKLVKIDLKSAKGNAFYLISLAQKKAGELGYSREKTQVMVNEMTSGDYENLLEVFEQHFQDYYELTR